MVDASVSGPGIARLRFSRVRAQLEDGRLEQVLSRIHKQVLTFTCCDPKPRSSVHGYVTS